MAAAVVAATLLAVLAATLTTAPPRVAETAAAGVFVFRGGRASGPIARFVPQSRAPGAARPAWREPVTGMSFVEVPAGRFVMGTPDDEAEREAQERQHEVALSRPFWIGRFEVTQAEWRAVMGTTPSHFAGDTLPVENVSWFEVADFLRRLAARSPGSRFRLPSEAEWEYACRAGSAAPFASGLRLDPAQANVAASPDAAAGGRTMPVGSFAPNAWGLHDMHGNVWEWTADEHCPYPLGTVTDPVAACGAALKVIRGGSWRFLADSARCGLRYTHRPQDVGPSLGFRVVRETAAGAGAR